MSKIERAELIKLISESSEIMFQAGWIETSKLLANKVLELLAEM